MKPFRLKETERVGSEVIAALPKRLAFADVRTTLRPRSIGGCSYMTSK